MFSPYILSAKEQPDCWLKITEYGKSPISGMFWWSCRHNEVEIAGGLAWRENIVKEDSSVYLKISGQVSIENGLCSFVGFDFHDKYCESVPKIFCVPFFSGLLFQKALTDEELYDYPELRPLQVRPLYYAGRRIDDGVR